MVKTKFPYGVRAGSVQVKIYSTPSHGCESYTLSYWLDGKRQRSVFADFSRAKLEAEAVAAKMSRSEPSSVFYRPQQHDILVYVPARKEIRIHAGTKGERKLYRQCFGQHLFGDEDFFPGEGKYTLAPLARDGTASLNCLDVEGIEWVRLREIEMLWGGGVNAEREIRKSADLFASFESRG